jgi:hypothetical protein
MKVIIILARNEAIFLVYNISNFYPQVLSVKEYFEAKVLNLYKCLLSKTFEFGILLWKNY